MKMVKQKNKIEEDSSQNKAFLILGITFIILALIVGLFYFFSARILMSPVESAELGQSILVLFVILALIGVSLVVFSLMRTHFNRVNEKVLRKTISKNSLK